jgi:peroxiredoxin
MNKSIVLLTGLLAVTACKKEEAKTSEPAKTAAAPVTKAAEPKAVTPTEPGSAAGTEKAAAAAPEMKLKMTADDKIGTAPEGLGLLVGAKAPTVSLLEIEGKEVPLADIYQQGPSLLVFYRGGWCPFCNLQLHELSESKAKFDALGVKLIAISVDVPSEEAKTKAKHNVAFTILSDSKLAAHDAFKVTKSNSEEEVKMLSGYGIDLGKYSGEKHSKFAVPSVFLVDKGGIVRFAHVDTDYQTRPSAAQLVTAVTKALAAK